MMHINIQCLSNKVDNLSLYLDKNSYDVICLSEHWLNEVTLNTINLPGYKLVNCFCRTVNKHGGVSIFLKQNIKFKPLLLSNFCCEIDAEFCGIEISCIKTVFITLYRSCAGKIEVFLEKLETLLEFLSNKYSKIVLAGDFNVNFRATSGNLNELVCLLNSFGLSVTISEFTRVTAQSASCIDNVLTNLGEDEYEVGLIDPCLSDHYGQFIKVCGNKDLPKTIMRRRFTNHGLLKFKTHLLDIDWSIFYNVNYDAAYMSEYLVNIFSTLVNRIFPLKKCNINKTMPKNWYNDSLRRKRDILSSIKIICNVTRNPDHYSTYNALRKDYNTDIKNAKRTAYDTFLNNSDNRARDAWRIINFETNNSRETVVNSDISHDAFNNYFTSAAENLIKSLPKLNHCFNTDFIHNLVTPNLSFFLYPITEQEVRTAIKSLKNSNSLDIYDLNAKMIKTAEDIIAAPLTALFNVCIAEGVFPDIFKCSRVIPLFKKGDDSLFENYRPISILPIFGKIFEKILTRRLTNYLEINSLLSPNQYGFRSGRSTSQAVLKVVSDIVEGLEAGHHTVITLCDLSKAFDCVSHDTLMEKMRLCGIRGLPLTLFQSYIKNRKQCVTIKNKNSEFLDITHGVPQGSVLGPLLFLIYINDFSHFMNPIKSIMFADDTTILCSDRNIDNLMELSSRNEQLAQDWFTLNELKLNQEKTQRLVISSNKNITTGANVKLLGIYLDDNLNWSSHIEHLNQKLASTCFLLRKLKAIVDFATLKNTYFSLFHSKLCYAVVLWGNSNHAIKSFRQQKKAIRIILNVNYREPCQPLFIKLGIMPLPSLFIYYSLIGIHKDVSNFSTHSDYHDYNTRTGGLLKNPRYRLTLSTKNSPNLKLYNHLPEQIKQLNLLSFKHKVKQFILQYCFYSNDEYLQTPYTP